MCIPLLTCKMLWIPHMPLGVLVLFQSFMQKEIFPVHVLYLITLKVFTKKIKTMKQKLEVAMPARQSFITIIDTFETIEECANDIIGIPDVKHVELIYNDNIKRWQMKAVANGNQCDKS